MSVAKQYGSFSALANVELEIDQGELIVLLGPSGCGKSTILKIIAGLEEATEGEVYINGRLVNYVQPKERDVAMVFQNYALYPHMTVRANLSFPLEMRGTPRRELAGEANRVADMLGLTQLLDKYPEHLSGGQRQRVALGRAIIRRPVAFLMDEPLSNLDALLRVQMRTDLLRLHRQVGRTTVYVTHDQVEAMTMADRIVVMQSGQIQQVGTPSDIYGRPANVFVATFVGSPPMNTFGGQLERSDGKVRFRGGELVVDLQASLSFTPLSEPVRLGIRPEHVVLVHSSDADAVAVGKVELIEDVGPENFVSIALPSGTCLVRTGEHGRVAEGDRVGLRFPTRWLHLFDASGNRIAA